MADGTQHAAAWDRATLTALFDPETGWLDRRVLSDESLYQLELERIFARGWNFMCHESQLKAPGDYLISYIGEDQVIVVRGADGEIRALLNTCRHRGNALCRAEQGRAKSFVCSYHGWNYALDGELIGVPGQSTFYHGELDKSRLSLAKARIESHLGFYFATLAEDAPSLHDYLGVTGRAGLGMICAHGEIEVAEGVQKNIIDCNWKIAVDNLFDWYHVPYSHASANTAGFLDIARIQFPKDQMVMLGEYGHAIGGPGIPRAAQDQINALTDAQRMELSHAQADMAPRIRPRAATDLMGPEGVRSEGHPNIFPNLWVTISGTQMCLRLPRGPSHTELWWYTLVPKAAPPEAKREIIRRMNHVFGPAGLLEQDDGENWSQSTRSSRGVASRTLGHNLQMGLGHDEAKVGAGGEHYIEGLISEHGQRWLYRAWTEWMSARDWAELKANHSAPPTGRV
ncbi:MULTISPECIES: aromatic ring-hydroxylating oxygenase subunit alpha [Phenylobacterium]|jgi:3-phenylpropionate/trans-cinnamate dioxygenase alpha subunit|uniref:Aromatic ring-hydroxylating dioxygenase subunit alpha n=1 Tax=Phenylobacterium conjunctum TaxID=1298959 RepID=A0ABW3SWW0_9CAUL